MLVTTGDTQGDTQLGQATVEMVHDVLIRHWERLRRWLEEDRDFLRWRQRLQAALIEWERSGHDAGALLRGAPLAEASRWLAERPEDLTLAERGFIQKSVALQERERTLWERRRRRLMWASIGVAGVLLLLAFFARWQRDEAEARRQQSERLHRLSMAQGLAAQALRQLNQHKDERSALLALQAYLFNQESQGHVLDQVVDTLRTVLSTLYFRHVLRGHEDRV